MRNDDLDIQFHGTQQQPTTLRPQSRPQRGGSSKQKASAPIWWGCGGCLGLIALGAILVTLIDSGGGESPAAVDLSGIEHAVRREIEMSQGLGLQYQLHSLEVTDGDWLALTLDLRSVPPSREAISKDAENWAEFVAVQQVDGKYVKDIFGKSVRVTILTAFEGDRILRWGSYRYASGWDPAEGYTNFDQLTK